MNIEVTFRILKLFKKVMPCYVKKLSNIFEFIINSKNPVSKPLQPLQRPYSRDFEMHNKSLPKNHNRQADCDK